jgi:glycosyltransferase involved in cell wall biosynthesis
MLTIGILLGVRDIGGTERQAAHLAGGLHARGMRVHLFFMQNERRRNPEAEIPFPDLPTDSLEAEPLTRWRFDKAALLAWLLRKHRIDVLQMFNLGAIEMGRRALWLNRQCAGVAAVRGLKFANDPWVGRRLGRAVGSRMPVTCNSEAIAEALRSTLGVDPARITVIRNGIAVPPPTRPEKPDRKRVPVVLFAGTLHEVKDPVTFVRGMGLAARQVGIRILIAGDGPLRDQVRSECERGLPAGSWQMLGAVRPDDVPYAAADLVVNSSWREGGSNTILEAMAHGKPVIATDTGANTWMVSESQAGLLVPARDPEGLAAAVMRLARDARARQAMGDRGPPFVRRHFDMDAMVEAHLRVYESADARRRDRR